MDGDNLTLEELRRIEPELRQIQKAKKMKAFNKKVDEMNKKLNAVSESKDVSAMMDEHFDFFLKIQKGPEGEQNYRFSKI